MSTESRYVLDNINVLVLDDNRHMRSLVQSILHALGVKNIREANDAADAFKELMHFHADVIICDWHMEPLDGIDFVNLVRTAKDSPNPYVPIIMLSGYTEYRRVVTARDAGVNEFLANPISAKALYQRFASIIENPRPFIRTSCISAPTAGGRTWGRRAVSRSVARTRQRRRPPPVAMKVFRRMKSTPFWLTKGCRQPHRRKLVMSEAQLIKASHTLRKAKIGNGPAKLDPDILKKAEQAVVETEKDFTGWAQEDLNDMEAALGRLKDGGDMTKELGEVFRIALDMKGQGGSFGFVMITRIAGSPSDFLEDRPSVGRLGLEAIAAHIGAMRAIMAQNVRDNGGDTGQALLAELQNLAAKAAAE